MQSKAKQLGFVAQLRGGGGEVFWDFVFVSKSLQKQVFELLNLYLFRFRFLYGICHSGRRGIFVVGPETWF